MCIFFPFRFVYLYFLNQSKGTQVLSLDALNTYTCGLPIKPRQPLYCGTCYIIKPAEAKHCSTYNHCVVVNYVHFYFPLVIEKIEKTKNFDHHLHVFEFSTL